MSDQALMEKLVENVNLLSQKVSKSVSGTPDAQSLFGTAGLFSNFGLDTTVINAGMSPLGIDRVLPAVSTTEMNPIYPFITGFESDGESEPTGPCDNAPGGELEVGHQTATFGRVTRRSQELEVNDLVKVLNGNLPTNLQLMGNLVGEGHQLMPSIPSGSQAIQQMVQLQSFLIGGLLQRKLATLTWTGDPANNTASNGYMEFPGLDMLIATGKVDAITGVATPALDPDVKDFDYGSISGSDPDILEYIAMMFYYLTNNAERSGLAPVNWVLAMRPQLFYELTRVWPSLYLTDRGGLAMAGNDAIVINDTNNTDLRDRMRQGSFLMINGVQVPVITDDGIYEENSTNGSNLDPGEFSSDIYFLPLSARGMPTLYWEHVDYRGAQQEINWLQGKQFWIGPQGRFMWTLEHSNYCFAFQAKVEPRLILRTPQLAGRIQNVKYSPLQHLRSPFEDSPYFKKGGSSSFSTPTDYYSEWNEQL